MKELENQIENHYDEIQLDDGRMDKLVKLTEAYQESKKIEHSFSARVRAFTQGFKRFGYRSVLATGLLAMLSVWLYTSATQSERASRTLREVAMNHSTRLDLEYHGESLASLDDSMQQLPFTLILPKEVEKNYQLIGSRYCSLDGNLAAHVKFKDSTTGKPVSLFVTSKTKSLNQISAQTKTLEGVGVTLWREGGLFYALAEQG